MTRGLDIYMRLIAPLYCLALLAPLNAVAQTTWARVGNGLVEAHGIHGLGLALENNTMFAGAPQAVAATPESEFDPLLVQPAGSLSIYSSATPSGDWALTQFLRSSATCPNDQFGISIVLMGDVAFVGAPGTIVGGLRSGAVFRFGLVGGDWVEQQIILPSTPQDFAGFGNHLATDGQQLIVGAPFHDANGIEEWGRAFVFEVSASGGDWSETGVVVPPPMSDHSWAGYRVAIDGHRAALGLFGGDTTGPGSGSICVFENPGPGWLPKQQVLPSQPTDWSHFSYELILRGDLLISGSYRAGPPGHHHGAVNIFHRLNDIEGYVDVQRLSPPGLEYGAVFGVSCALLNNGKLAVGIPGAHGVAGRVAIYSELPDRTYKLDSIQFPPGTTALEAFGWKVATDGVRMVATSARGIENGEPRGIVHVWRADQVEFETPRCHASNATPQNPRPVLLRSHGSLASGARHTRLTASELPPGAIINLIATPAHAPGRSIGWGCLTGPALRLTPTLERTNPGGTCTWWLGGIAAAEACTAGSTWSFQVQAWHNGARSVSNALDLHFRP